MSEIEVPLEQIQEEIHHRAMHEGSGHGGGGTLVNRAALLSALLAVCAAVSALFAGHLANEAMIAQIQSSDHWSYYQAKGIKLSLAEMRNQLSPDPKMVEKIEGYKKDQEEIKALAEEKEHESRAKLEQHESLAAAVTLFQVAIALTAIAVLTRKKSFVGASALLAVAGVIWMIKSFLM